MPYSTKKTLKNRLIIGITGASGVIYGRRILEVLRDLKEVETHLIITKYGKRLIESELGVKGEEIERLADFSYDDEDMEAPPASGSFEVKGMIVIPCSIKTLSAISISYSPNLLVRAADVTLKERRPLVLVVRETPLHTGHLELMLRVSKMGGVIMPASPGFYSSPSSINDLVDFIVGKALVQAGIPTPILKKWKGNPSIV